MMTFLYRTGSWKIGNAITVSHQRVLVGDYSTMYSQPVTYLNTDQTQICLTYMIGQPVIHCDAAVAYKSDDLTDQ